MALPARPDNLSRMGNFQGNLRFLAIESRESAKSARSANTDQDLFRFAPIIRNTHGVAMGSHVYVDHDHSTSFLCRSPQPFLTCGPRRTSNVLPKVTGRRTIRSSPRFFIDSAGPDPSRGRGRRWVVGALPHRGWPRRDRQLRRQPQRRRRRSGVFSGFRARTSKRVKPSYVPRNLVRCSTVRPLGRWRQ